MTPLHRVVYEVWDLPCISVTNTHILEETGQTVMNRDEWMYNLSHVCDPMLNMDSSNTKILGTRSNSKISHT